MKILYINCKIFFNSVYMNALRTGLYISHFKAHLYNIEPNINFGIKWHSL